MPKSGIPRGNALQWALSMPCTPESKATPSSYSLPFASKFLLWILDQPTIRQGGVIDEQKYLFIQTFAKREK